MSTQPASSPAEPIRVLSHSTLIYWWPVWLAGFILAGLTYADNTRLAVLPPDTSVKAVQPGKVYELTVKNNQPTPNLDEAAANTEKGQDAFDAYVSRNRNYGMVYLAVVLLVVVGSNVPLRGFLSVIFIMGLVLVT